MNSIYKALAGVVVLVLLLAGAYTQGRSDGRAAEVATQQHDAEIARQTREAALTATAEAIAKIEIRHVTIRQELEKEIYEKPVYRDCRHSPDGMLWINRALLRPGSAGDSELPWPDGTL